MRSVTAVRAFGASIVWIWSHTSAIPRVCVRVFVCICVCTYVWGMRVGVVIIHVYMYIHFLCHVWHYIHMCASSSLENNASAWVNKRNVYRWSFGNSGFYAGILCVECACFILGYNCFGSPGTPAAYSGDVSSLSHCSSNFLSLRSPSLDNNGAFRGTTKPASSSSSSRSLVVIT